MPNLNQIVWKERYDISCPSCGHEMQCAPSMFHQMGLFTTGGGFCSECDAMMEIHFEPETNSMTTFEYQYPSQEEQSNEQ